MPALLCDLLYRDHLPLEKGEGGRLSHCPLQHHCPSGTHHLPAPACVCTQPPRGRGPVDTHVVFTPLSRRDFPHSPRRDFPHSPQLSLHHRVLPLPSVPTLFFGPKHHGRANFIGSVHKGGLAHHGHDDAIRNWAKQLKPLPSHIHRMRRMWVHLPYTVPH